jgi:hypothetical protein
MDGQGRKVGSGRRRREGAELEGENKGVEELRGEGVEGWRGGGA